MVKQVTISGMHCHHCVNAVQNVLSDVVGVEVLDVEIGSASIETSDVNDHEITAVIEQEGYAVTDIRSH